MWPTVTSAPTIVGCAPRLPRASLSTWTTVPSWTLDRSPMTIGAPSPRKTQPYQTEASSLSSTSPTTDAVDAQKAAAPTRGSQPWCAMHTVRRAHRSHLRPTPIRDAATRSIVQSQGPVQKENCHNNRSVLRRYSRASS